MECRTCGEEFENRDKRVRYCEKCRLPDRERRAKALRELRVRQRLFAEKRCVDCDAPFSSKSARCSDCAKERRRKQRLLWERFSKGGVCPDCGKAITRRSARCQSCAKKQDTNRGPNNPAWKGGRTLHSSGHVMVRVNGRYVLEHRHVWEQAHGPIPKGHHVHHLNGIKTDNRLENLVAMDKSLHHRNHHEPWEARIRDLEAQLVALPAPQRG